MFLWLLIYDSALNRYLVLLLFQSIVHILTVYSFYQICYFIFNYSFFFRVNYYIFLSFLHLPRFFSLVSVNILLITCWPQQLQLKKKQIILTISVCMFGMRSYYFPLSLRQQYNMIKAYWIKTLNTWALSDEHSSVQIRLQQVLNNRILWEGSFCCYFIIVYLELSLSTLLTFGLIQSLFLLYHFRHWALQYSFGNMQII